MEAIALFVCLISPFVILGAIVFWHYYDSRRDAMQPYLETGNGGLAARHDDEEQRKALARVALNCKSPHPADQPDPSEVYRFMYVDNPGFGPLTHHCPACGCSVKFFVGRGKSRRYTHSATETVFCANAQCRAEYLVDVIHETAQFISLATPERWLENKPYIEESE